MNTGEKGPTPVRLIIRVKQRRLTIKAGTELRNREVVSQASGTVYNIFGRAERLQASIAIGRHTYSPFSFQFTKPLSWDGNHLFVFSLYQQLHQRQSHLAHPDVPPTFHNEGTTGTAISYHKATSRFGTHTFSYELAWRNMFMLSKEASHSLISLSGHSIKSSFRYAWNFDRRDDPLLPSRGYQLKLAQEVAGIPALGSVQFSKTELGLQGHFPFFGSRASLSLASRGTVIVPFGKTRETPYMDRAFLGGPLSVRGFPAQSIGPRDNFDSLGGDVGLEACVSVSFPLLHPVRGHVFLNGGNLALFSKDLFSKDAFKTFIRHSPLSFGYGVAFKIMDAARLEVNMSYPLFNSMVGTSGVGGLQFGIGMDFL
jgi:outer membrane protein insertion porin family